MVPRYSTNKKNQRDQKLANPKGNGYHIDMQVDGQANKKRNPDKRVVRIAHIGNGHDEGHQHERAETVDFLMKRVDDKIAPDQQGNELYDEKHISEGIQVVGSAIAPCSARGCSRQTEH